MYSIDTATDERIVALTYRLDMALYKLAQAGNIQAFEDAEERMMRIIEIAEDIARESGVDVSA